MDQGLLAEFLAECGLNGPYQVEVFSHDDATTQIHECRQPFLIIGQREGSDLRLDHWLVGRRHVFLQLIEGRFRCVDLGARTGTHGGIASDRAGWVDPDRPLKIGPYLVRPLIPNLADRPYPPLPIVTWSQIDRPETEPRWSMNRALALVGRSPFCEVKLLDAAVSRFHCGLVLTARGVWVVDLLSQKPLLVNGTAVRFAPVRPGDTLQVGPFRLTPHYDMSLIRAVTERTLWTPPEAISTPPSPLSASFPRESTEASADGSSADLLPALMPTLVVPASPWDQPLARAGEVAPPAVQEVVVTALVQQFGAMQQQMFDQFHQMMMAMFEQFAALHRESSATIRAEFDEVRKLSGEIESLRTETSRLAEASTLALQQSALDRSSHHGAAPPPPPAPRPAPPRSRPGSVPPAGPIPGPEPTGVQAQPTAPPPLLPPLPPIGEPPVDIHAQLCLRLNQMETERQSRWQKILALITTARA